MYFRVRSLLKYAYHKSNISRLPTNLSYLPINYVTYSLLDLGRPYSTISNKLLASSNFVICSDKVSCSTLDDSDLKEKLNQITNDLRNKLPNFFSESMNYDYYHQDLIFENNITNKTTVGLSKYVFQMNLLRIIAHLKYGYLRMEVLQILPDPQELSITIRWRIRGISGLRLLFMFWKFKLSKPVDHVRNEETWYDGISRFYLDQNGLVYKHVVTRLMPGSSTETDTSASNLLKTILAVGLVPKNNPAEYL